MGVYINMEMPSSCFDCPLGISVNFGVLCCPTHTIISDDNLFDADGRELRRQDWCPLVEVPEPHGDLIDVEELMEKVAGLVPYYIETGYEKAFTDGLSSAYEIVKASPTIITASEEG